MFPHYIIPSFSVCVITYFQIVLVRNCVLGKSLVRNESTLFAKCFHCYFAELILGEKLKVGSGSLRSQVPIPMSSNFQKLLLDFSRSG